LLVLSFLENLFYDDIYIFSSLKKSLGGNLLNELKKYESNTFSLLSGKLSLLNLSNIIQFSGLKTIKKIELAILHVIDNNHEFSEYKTLFEDLESSANDEEVKHTVLSDELVSIILDSLGMVVFHRKNSNTLSSLSYKQEGSKLRLNQEWSAYIRDNGYESVINYTYEDETILRTSDALLKYGYKTIERVYERTNTSLDDI